MDMAVLTEMKLTNDKNTAYCFGYSVCASHARSGSQGGVAIAFNNYDDHFDMSLFCHWGPDVISIMMSSGNKHWMIVEIYIPPTVKKDIWEAMIEDLYKAVAPVEG